ncbi:MAG: cytochrome c oxidase assembly protein [Alphaproteobacteria bacterium]
MSALGRKNRRLVVVLTTVAMGMVGMSYAAVPLYDLFCRVTGYGGTTQIAAEKSGSVTQRPIKVRFDAMVTNIDWAFQPVQRQIELQVGENAVAFYRATNQTKQPLTGTATFNVTPLKVGAYFSKVECFCFTEQTLLPGQTVDMPVAFYVDPDISNDPNLNDVKTITLSYTFYPVDKLTKPVLERQVSAKARSIDRQRSIQ